MHRITDAKFCLHPDDPENFLKLSAALHIIVQHQISDQDIENVDRLLREYTSGLICLYGSSSIKPNHHYATHVSECARNFGPLHDFWMFLFECLNKVLKSYKTNNHGNGELETTFFHEFQRTCQTNRMTYTLVQLPKDSLPSAVADIMIKASNEEQGMVAGLAALSKDLDDVVTDADQVYMLSPRHHLKDLSTDTYRLLAETLCLQFPLTPVHCRMDRPLLSHSLPLNRQAIFFDYVVLRGKRYYASRTTGFNHSSFVHVVIPNNGSPCHAYGEILEIFQFEQNLRGQGNRMWFARMRWLKAWRAEPSPWDKFSVVDVRLWELGEYLDRDTQLPHLIDPDWVTGQLAMMTVSVSESKTKVWATIDISKVLDTHLQKLTRC
ncbi:hypothetical protein DFH29DRAFT_1001034 [Suillus ampliporus]|nr:hypothetical protein DFH29DRAFT_1001034 [Suillus ampliporus]